MSNKSFHLGVKGIIEVFFIAACVVGLYYLGSWQLDRKEWKENLLKTLDRNQKITVHNVPSDVHKERDQFKNIILHGQLLGDQEVFWSGHSVKGRPSSYVIAPMLIFNDQSAYDMVLVVRGSLPSKAIPSRIERTRMNIQALSNIEGFLLFPRQKDAYRLDNQPENNLWFTMNFKQLSDHFKGHTIAPVLVVETSPLNNRDLTAPLSFKRDLPNNHLIYAITWFALCLIVAGMGIFRMLTVYRK